MPTVSTRVLKDQLSSYLQRAEAGEQIVVLRDGRPVAALVPLSQLQERDEQARLAELASRGVVTLPKRTSRRAFQSAALPNRGKLASEMVLEDREREQETLYVLQNKSLMEQIERSLKTHWEGTGYRPSPKELDALDRP